MLIETRNCSNVRYVVMTIARLLTQKCQYKFADLEIVFAEDAVLFTKVCIDTSYMGFLRATAKKKSFTLVVNFDNQIVYKQQFKYSDIFNNDFSLSKLTAIADEIQNSIKRHTRDDKIRII